MLNRADRPKALYSCGDRPSLDNKTGDWRQITPTEAGRPSPCRQACLLDGEIPAWLEAVKGERWEEAWRIMRRSNPFPAITGRVCFHPCTMECNRRLMDQAIDIPAMERAIGMWRLERYRPPAAPRVLRGRVAVIGSGPAGLSCAYYLNEAGYRVTIFEKAPVAGGMLALGIPSYRLPRELLAEELKVLTADGVQFRLDSALGRDFNLEQLYGEFDQLFLATGAWRSRALNIPGADRPGTWSALDYLTRIHLGETVPLAEPVVVIGGGNAAVDAARTALRENGMRRVSILYRRSRAEMPADPAEVEAAAAEGVELIFNVIPREIKGGEPLLKVLLDRTVSGDGGVKILPDDPVSMAAGSLIYALGQEPDLSFLDRLSQPRFFYAGGDLITGPATVPEAIKAGRIAAQAIAGRLAGRPETAAPPAQGAPVTFDQLNLWAVTAPQPVERQADPAEEAGRCLGCGTCNSCGICYLFCPDVAVQREQGRYSINLDYCKGCGICARECPARVLTLEGGAGYAS
ncbi:MAG: FAD-dependent oxidoreductase [Bacillota bacterium]